MKQSSIEVGKSSPSRIRAIAQGVASLHQARFRGEPNPSVKRTNTGGLSLCAQRALWRRRYLPLTLGVRPQSRLNQCHHRRSAS